MIDLPRPIFFVFLLVLLIGNVNLLGSGLAYVSNIGRVYALGNNDSSVTMSGSNDISAITNATSSGNISGIQSSNCYLLSGYQAALCLADQLMKRGTAGLPFFIQSKLNGMVIEIAGAERGPHGKLQTNFKKDSDNDNQLWTAEVGGIIKSKLNGMVIDIANAERGPHGVLQTYPAKNGDNDNQLWTSTPEGFIKSKLNGMVIDIANAERGPHGVLQTYPAKNGDNDNQRWDLVPVINGIPIPDYIGSGIVVTIPPRPPIGR